MIKDFPISSFQNNYLDIADFTNIFIFSMTFNLESSCNELWFTGQHSQPL